MYLPEERETVIRYDELDNCWYFESNVRRHVTKILKMEHAFESIKKEFENNFCISVRAKLSNLDDFSVNPFVRKKAKMTEEQKRRNTERLKSILS
ncbi:hypothetical protein ACLMK5_01595 [Streptococcus anginosus]|uniref:Uncharacterized protein n=1 Tax=Streptococcus vaginalis TaxID=2748301 RepID=A0ABS3GAS7_9STRE|nr:MULTISPECIES: hypothetical protein [Streptococcus]MBF7075526.1 hypothetical protein [Streptococcus sp. HF-100]MBO0363762.1 hypothetical protein [Streptococcus vaginalis]